MKTYTLNNAPAEHEHDPVVTLTPEGPHYGRRRCRFCGLFLGWEPHPDTAGRKAKLREQILALESLKLKGWDGQFISDAARNEKCKFSPKQLEQIERIAKENGV